MCSLVKMRHPDHLHPLYICVRREPDQVLQTLNKEM